MMLNFAVMTDKDAIGALPQGTHVMTLSSVGELKENRGGKLGFCVWYEKAGYKPVMQYVQMSDNVFDKRRILNLLTAFKVTLEQREYQPKEIYKLIKACENKKCEAEIVLKDDKFTNDKNEVVEFKRREIGTLLPLSEAEEVFIEEDDDDLDIDLS